MTTALDLIRTKRDQLVVKRDQMSAGINVLAGAISVCEELIEQIARVSMENAEGPTAKPRAAPSRPVKR